MIKWTNSKMKVILFNTSYKRNCSNNQYRKYHSLNYHYHRSGGWQAYDVILFRLWVTNTQSTFMGYMVRHSSPDVY
jgi:hypothetical protein